MKIVFLAPFGIRPKGTLIARMLPLAVELQSLGHRVVIIAPPYTNPEDSGRSETVEGVLLRNIKLGPRNKALAAPILAWRMLRGALAEKPDLIHLFKPKGYGGLAAMLLLLLRRAGFRMPPLFLDSDDREGTGGMNELQGYSALEKRFYAFQEQWLMRRATGISVASRGLETLAGKLGVPPVRVLYLPNGVRDQRPGNGSAVRSRLGINPAAPVVLLYSRFFEFDQAKLAAVFSGIHHQVPTVRFLVVGRGRNNEEARLLEAARAGGYAGNLLMAGWVEPGELPDYLSVGDVAIYPFADTLVNRCKCPAKATELLMAGCPLVADRVGQLTEYVRAGTSGILCDPADWGAMAAETVALLQDAGRRRTLGAAGRTYLLTRFAWHTFAGKLDGFYRAHSAVNDGESR
jgi:glycosyltransferase involved in cell wall biosynthesis